MAAAVPGFASGPSANSIPTVPLLPPMPQSVDTDYNDDMDGEVICPMVQPFPRIIMKY